MKYIVEEELEEPGFKMFEKLICGIYHKQDKRHVYVSV